MKISQKTFLLLGLLGAIFLVGFTIKDDSKSYELINEIEISNQQAFDTMMDVISHPRCINCHPSDRIPKRGMNAIPHPFGMDGAESNLSYETLLCAACHGEENDLSSGKPGAPHWDLAPASMAWDNLTREEIAKSMLNPKNNGNRSYEDILKHLTEDELVLWAFNPGTHPDGTARVKPPVSEEDFKEAVKTWFKNGAIIPGK